MYLNVEGEDYTRVLNLLNYKPEPKEFTQHKNLLNILTYVNQT